MHSHDRTPIASLGFLDEDNGLPLHDLACAYICRDEVASAVVGPLKLGRTKRVDRIINVRRWSSMPPEQARERWVFDGTLEQQASHRTVKEMPVLKGEGKYQTTIGFLDAVIYRTVVTAHDGGIVKHARAMEFIYDKLVPHEVFGDWGLVAGYDWRAAREVLPNHFWFEKEQTAASCTVGVEVKINRVPVGDLLRQMKLYASHVGNGFSIEQIDEWVVALRYDIDEAYASALKSEGIRAIRLGKPFDAWLAARKKTPVKLGQI